MKKSYFLLTVVGLILLSAIVLRVISLVNENKSTENNRNKKTEQVKNDSKAADSDHSSSVLTASSTVGDMEATFSKEALVVTPKQNEVVVSPLKIEGNIVGSWFFEGSLPVKLFDNNNNLIASGLARADGDWMTVKPVPFKASIEFSTIATSGYVVILKDNPSGLPENDGSIKLPVKFK